MHATHVILPAGESVDEGAWAQFEIALYDGSAGLAGLGRCVTVVDNGEERLPHQRFDVVFDSLQFETHEQRVFDHILALHGVGGSELEQVADADAESLPPQSTGTTGNQYVDVSTDFSGAQPLPLDSLDEDGEQTLVASAEELEAAISDYQSARPAPGGEANDVTPTAAATPPATPPKYGAAGGGGYGRVAAAHAVQPSAFEEAFEEPVSGERIAPTRPLNGTAFAYTNGIPFPASPPRPQLEASLRVTPAPRPAHSR